MMPPFSSICILALVLVLLMGYSTSDEVQSRAMQYSIDRSKDAEIDSFKVRNSGNSLEAALPSLSLLNASIVDSPVFSPDDTDFIVSVTVRIYCNTVGALIYYTLDESIPSESNPNAFIIKSGDAILINKIGTTNMGAIALKQGWTASPLVSKAYNVMDICTSPTFSHKPSSYGLSTFAGAAEITISSATIGATIHYTFDCLAAPVTVDAFPYHILNGGSITIDVPGLVCIHAIATKVGLANSATSQASYTILPKVKTPIITPAANEFVISATIYITSPTPNSTLRYTTDGSDPTEESSMQMTSGSEIVIEDLGEHTIKAFATLPNMISSDIAIKKFSILERVGVPVMIPAGGSYVDDFKVTVICPDNVMNREDSGARVHYTTSSYGTPTIYSPSVACGQPIILYAPGRFTLRIMVTSAKMSPSAIVQANFVITRPLFDEYPVMKRANVSIDCLPIVDIEIVEKDIPLGGSCGSRLVRGRMIVMENPIGHFDMLDPLNGCNSGKLELPSISGRAFRAHKMLDNSSFYSKYDRLTDDEWEEWNNQYKRVSELGCEIVTNAGFFNVTSGRCFGNIVSQGNIIQAGNYHNVNFGIRNGSFFIGYVNETDILSESNPFDTMMSGITWLVRHGKSYVAESMSSMGDAEDMSSWQSTGYQFASVLSARTAIGYDKQGRLRLLQVEGETWVRGMSLYDFAEFAVELGIESAINLDGGGSATMTINHTLVSEPSWRCTEDVNGLLDHLPNANGYYRCEKPVASITCIHASPPPPKTSQLTSVPPTTSPTTVPTSPVLKPTDTPTETPTVSPTALQTQSPSYLPTIYTRSPTIPNERSHNSANYTAGDSNCSALLSNIESAVRFYQFLSIGLGLILMISLIVNISCFCKSLNTANFANAEKLVEVAEAEDETTEENNFDNSGPYDPYLGSHSKDIEMNTTPFSNKLSDHTLNASSVRRDNVSPSWAIKLKGMKFDLDDDSDDNAASESVSNFTGNKNKPLGSVGNSITSNINVNNSNSTSNNSRSSSTTAQSLTPTATLNSSSNASNSGGKSNGLGKSVDSPLGSGSKGGSRTRPKKSSPVPEGYSDSKYASSRDEEEEDGEEYHPLHRLKHK